MEPRTVARYDTDTWIVESGYTTVQFSVRNLLLFNVRGRFAELTGSMRRDGTDVRGSSVEATLRAAGIDTGNRRRDTHLRSSDFLDSEKFPEIRFESTKVEKGTDRDTLRVTGMLTIKASSREVVLDVTEMDRSSSPRGDEVAYYAATTRINRFDFGVNYGRGFIGSDITIRIHVQALRRKR